MKCLNDINTSLSSIIILNKGIINNNSLFRSWNGFLELLLQSRQFRQNGGRSSLHHILHDFKVTRSQGLCLGNLSNLFHKLLATLWLFLLRIIHPSQSFMTYQKHKLMSKDIQLQRTAVHLVIMAISQETSSTFGIHIRNDILSTYTRQLFIHSVLLARGNVTEGRDGTHFIMTTKTRVKRTIHIYKKGIGRVLWMGEGV